MRASGNSLRRHAKISQREIFLKRRPCSRAYGANHARKASTWSPQRISAIVSARLKSVLNVFACGGYRVFDLIGTNVLS